MCGIEVTPKLLERALLHIIDRRGHLLQDVRSRAIYFVEEAGQDLGSFLEQNPLFAPRRSSEVADFVESLWRSVSGKRSRCCANWRLQRKNTNIRSQEERSVVEAPGRSETPSGTYYRAESIQTSDRIVSSQKPAETGLRSISITWRTTLKNRVSAPSHNVHVF